MDPQETTAPAPAPEPADAAPAPVPAPSPEAAPTAEQPVEAPTDGSPADGAPAPAPSDAPPAAADPQPVAGELQADPTEAPTADEGTPVAQWIGAAAIAVLLAVVSGLVLRRAFAPPAVGLGAPSPPEIPAAPTGAQPVPEPETQPEPTAAAEPTGLARFTAALSRTAGAFRDLFGRPIDEALIEELEDALLSSDVGMDTSTRLLDRVRAAWKGGETGPDALGQVLRDATREILTSVHEPLSVDPDKTPWVLLVVGVNGSGKTTTIGKLAARFTDEGRKVLLAAGDTYRAAAAEQLQVWAERSGADFVRGEEGGDPGAVAYDALQKATARGHDVVIIDTAGRLQTRKPLMDQLSKIRRVIGKVVEDGPHETLLVIDGTMGQNALSQARLFHEATPLTGVTVTKLDGTAKGGVVLAVAAELELPVKLVGVGEQVDDLRDFDPDAFVDALLPEPGSGHSG